MQAFNVNTDEVVKLSNKLEKLHKSALPIAVRGTLNDVAFEAKQKFVEKEFNKQFIIRKRNFIKAHTIVNKSINTFNVNQMQSEMGVIKGKSQAGDELDVQEFGGVIKKREFIPMNPSRASKSPSKLISKRFYLQNIKAKKDKPIFKNQDFIRAAFKVGKNGFLLFENILIQIRNITKKNGLFIKMEPLYSYEKGRSITLKKSPFIEPSGLKASKNMNNIFYENAQKQFDKYLR